MLNTANTITLLRIFLVPALAVVMMQEQHICTLAVFVVAALSDAADGIIARRWNQRTTLGAILDPLADKAMLLTAFVLLGRAEPPYMGLPLGLIVAVVFRDVLIMVGVALIHMLVGRVRWGPSWISKVNTVVQITTVLTAVVGNALVSQDLAGWPLSALRWLLPVMIGAALVTTVWSTIDYIFRGMRALGEASEAETSPARGSD